MRERRIETEQHLHATQLLIIEHTRIHFKRLQNDTSNNGKGENIRAPEIHRIVLKQAKNVLSLSRTWCASKCKLWLISKSLIKTDTHFANSATDLERSDSARALFKRLLAWNKREKRRIFNTIIWIKCATKWVESALRSKTVNGNHVQCRIASNSNWAHNPAMLCIFHRLNWIESSIYVQCKMYIVQELNGPIERSLKSFLVILWVWRQSQRIRLRNGYVDERLIWELRHYLKWGVVKCDRLCD